MCDILVSKKAGKFNLAYRATCFTGEYTTSYNFKYNVEQPLPYLSVKLCGEKLRQPNEQHSRYIKSDVPHYKVPMFLQHTEKSTVDIQ